MLLTALWVGPAQVRPVLLAARGGKQRRGFGGHSSWQARQARGAVCSSDGPAGEDVRGATGQVGQPLW